DDFGNPGAVTDPMGNTSRIVFLDGLPREAIRPDAATARFGFDATGNLNDLITLNPAGEPIVITHEVYAQGRRQSTLDPATGVLTSYKYDDAGRVLFTHKILVDPIGLAPDVALIDRADYDFE